MSRFFRSALFPLLIIVLLVWLASQTLLPNRDERQKIAYSELINAVQDNPTEVKDLVFSPKGKSIEATVEGKKVKTNYPSDESQASFQRNLQARKPRSLSVCALLTKPERRENDVECRYIGFEIPNRFVIGYGLDFAERYRNLPYIGVLHPDLVPGAH